MRKYYHLVASYVPALGIVAVAIAVPPLSSFAIGNVATQAVLLTAHGTARRVKLQLREMGHQVHEAVCPLVKRAHLAAAKESALAVQNYAAATDGSSCGITSVIKSSSVRLDSSKVMSPVGNMKQM